MSQNPPKHGPNRLNGYLETHRTRLAQLKADGFVGNDTLELTRANRQFLLKGEIACQGGVVIRVGKALRILENNGWESLIETDWYAYNVSIRGGHNVFRYDNQDEDYTFRRGHGDPHHKHIFDWRTGDELETKWIGADGWPNLDEVILETRDWYWRHRGELNSPEEYPALGVRSCS